MIETHNSEVFEALGTTVAIKHVGPGEFKGIYWDEVNKAFISIHNIDPDRSYVDADTITKMRHVHSGFKQHLTDDIGLSKSAMARLEDCLTPDDKVLVKSLLRKYHKGFLTDGFKIGCAEQVRDWAEGGSTHYSPLSPKQWFILKKVALI